MSLAPCIGALLCVALTAPAASQSPGSSRSSAAEVNYAVSSRGVDVPLSASVVTGTGSSPEAGSSGVAPEGSGGIASFASPEPGILLVAGSLLVWVALARRRNLGASR